jgi:hypothetical protein
MNMKFDKKAGFSLASIGITGFIIGALILAGLGVGGYFAFNSLSIASSFTPIYCNDYEFTCCQPIYGTIGYSLTNSQYIDCPSDVVKCEVTNAQTNPNSGVGILYYGNTNCRYYAGFLGIGGLGGRYICDGEVQKQINGNTNVDVPAGYKIYYYSNNGQSSLTVKFTRQRLAFTGRAASGSGGVPVKSDSCSFTTSKGTIKGSDGADLGTSYTVPLGDCVLSWQSGDRHICGNLEEKCDLDTDCASHTYGNNECTGRTLQTYGCKKYDIPSNVAYIDGQYRYTGYDNIVGSSTFNGIISRCEITSAVNVQCCGDTDCGSSFVCDKNSWTCKPAAQVECTRASDCGVSTQCDYITKKIKTPTCTSNKCGYSEKAVDCCIDSNCAADKYCAADNKCELKTDIIKECAFECCNGMKGYTNKTCASGKYCVNNICSTTPGCNDDNDCNINQKCDSGECIEKNAVCDPETKFFGLVTGSVKTISKCGFLGSACWFGVKPALETSCVYDWSPFWLLLVFILLAGIVAVGIFFAIGYWKKKNE